MSIRRSDRVGRAVPSRNQKPARANEKSYGTTVGMTKDGPALFVNQGGKTSAVNLNLSGSEGKATGGISITSIEVDGEQLTTSMSDVSDFSGSGTFSATGVYAGLRAGATTASDVDLGNVTNNAQLKIASNLSDLASASTARTNIGLGNVLNSVHVPVTGGTFTGNVNFASIEEIGNGAACDLTKMVTFFSTGGAETATLAASGTDGVIKVLYMSGDSGNMVITVTNPAWGGSGYLTFADVYDCVILMYFNSKWNIIANIGVSAS